jgi:hypothetical protein
LAAVFPFYFKFKKKKKKKGTFFFLCVCVSLELHRAARQDPGQSGATGPLTTCLGWANWLYDDVRQQVLIYTGPTLWSLFFFFLFHSLLFFVFLFSFCVLDFYFSGEGGVRERESILFFPNENEHTFSSVRAKWKFIFFLLSFYRHLSHLYVATCFL